METTQETTPTSRRKADAKVSTLTRIICISVDFWAIEVTGYGDSSATYWELYVSEAEINDQKLVDTLTTDMTAISILVSDDSQTPNTAST